MVNRFPNAVQRIRCGVGPAAMIAAEGDSQASLVKRLQRFGINVVVEVAHQEDDKRIPAVAPLQFGNELGRLAPATVGASRLRIFGVRVLDCPWCDRQPPPIL
jgi:hypothetical protein